MLIGTCAHLIRFMVNWHTNLCWRFIFWTVKITTLPVRALAALQREKMMERLIQEMQGELQNLILDNKMLEGHLQISIKEHRLMESMLSELEEDLDKAIEKIELLETEVQHLKGENFRLREVQSKTLWDPTSKISAREDEITGTHDKCPPYEMHWQSGKSTMLTENPLVHEGSWADNGHAGTQPNPTGLVDPLTPLVFSSDIDNDAALLQRREVALSQSLFSALLSLLVGLIIWAAEEPCMPLVMALFTVVGLSLRSVVHFFLTIKNRPASNAVALLSFNWFILGALTYPTLPRVAHMLSPALMTLLERMSSGVGWAEYV